MNSNIWRIICCIIIFSKCYGKSPLDIRVTTALEIIASIHKNYHQGCVSFIYTEYSGLANLTRWCYIVKYLSAVNIQINSISTEQLLNASQSTICGEMPGLLIMMSSSLKIQRFLEDLDSQVLQDNVWLLFLNENQNYKEFLSNVSITFSTRFLVAQRRDDAIWMMEVFRITFEQEAHKTIYGRWTLEQGLVLSNISFSERRTQLYGYTIRAVSVYDPPLAIFDNNSKHFEKMDGFLGHVWSLLENKMNFTTNFVSKPGLGWGNIENGNWNGMIKMIVDDEVDFAVSDFTMTTDRMHVVDYTVPILYQRLKVYIRMPTNADKTRWQGFLNPFTSRLWMVVCLCMVFIAILLFIFNRVYLKFGVTETSICDCGTLHETIFVTCKLFCSQGHDVNINITSWRIIFIFTYITSYVILAAYSAYLISSLAKQPIVMPFVTLDGLIRDGRYEFRVLQKSSAFETFKTSNDITLRRIFYRHLRRNIDDLPVNSIDALQKLCSSKKYSMQLYADIVSGMRNRIDCDIIPLPGETFAASVAMVASKGNPYLPVINYFLTKLRNHGVLQRLRFADWPPQPESSGVAWASVSMVEVLPVLLVLALGIIISLLILVVEIHVKRIGDLRLKQIPSFKKRNMNHFEKTRFNDFID